MDLIAHPRAAAYNPTVAKRTFRQRIGDRLLLEREQVKHWSRRKAAIETKVNDGTIQAMERGKNAGWDFFERYATALDLTFEQVCREVLGMEEVEGRVLDPDEQSVLETLSLLKTLPEDRDAFLRTADIFRLRGQQAAAPATPTSARAADRPASDSRATAHATSGPSRRSRGRH